MKTYRIAFIVALAGNVLLAAALGFLWWRIHAADQEVSLAKLRSYLPAALERR